ncbi:MAG: glutamate synthase large subunit, partial [Chloroflexi bacterium]|nr:glutamate synthase large subunit [Chloroflexota bacterium]
MTEPIAASPGPVNRPPPSPRRARHAEAPLYNPSFEHDACGVGFVADAGARSRDRVLPLALAGLSSLAHRGAFGADGRSSDGAGIALPLERSIWELVDGGRGTAGQAIIGLFLPRSSRAQTAARRLVERALADERLVCRRWRAVPVYPDVLGPEARASLPAIFQVVVRAASPVSGRRDLDQRLLLARRRMEIQAERSRITEFAVTSASSRSVVYKGLVAGGSLAAFYPDLAQPIEVSHATFHQRYATNTRPRWPLAQPFRLVAHNGEINTVRGNREQVRGRAGTLGGRFGARVAALGPLLSEDGSDSLSLDELLDLMVAAGWSLEAALLAAIPEAQGLRVRPHPEIIEFQRRLAGRLAPWDGPAAIVFSDGRRVGAILDRNGLRPAAYAVTSHGIVTLASEAGAVPLTAAETVERGRLGPGEMLLVEPGRGRLWHDEEAKREALRGHIAVPLPSVARAPSGVIANRSGMIDPATVVASPDNAQLPIPSPTDIGMRWLYGLDAERLRFSIKSMAMEGTEPLWSMGDDTPLPGLSRKDRPVTDHLRQSFAQVTNPAIDPERERIVMDLRVDLGRRPALLRPRPGQPFTLSLAGPVLARPDELLDAFKELRGTDRLSTLDTTWRPSGGGAELDAALTQLGERAVRLSRRGVELLVLDDRRLARGGVASAATLPSVLAAGAVHTALTRAGLRGRTDLVVVAADLLDVHSVAMALAAGATAVSPWLAVELAAEFAGGRGAEHLTAEGARANLVTALEKGLRKVLARMGISCLASYIGGQFFEVLELSDEIAERCFPAAPRWAGRVGFEALASRQQRRLAQALAFTPIEKLPDPGFARFRADGEGHLYAPSIVRAVQGVAAPDGADPAVAAETLRIALGREPALVRDQLAVRRSPNPGPLNEVEPAEAIMRRFVSAAMSLGSLSPESHQAVTLGMRMAGGASNTGEGGEDPAWYVEVDGRRHDAAIKQVASARFGVTATYLSRAEQLEIKIAQGSKPGEGGQLPGRKVTPLIAALRRGQPGQSMISPPPHHDIYSIEDLAQLIADLRAINPGARIGVKLVAALGVGTIAAGVAKAGADYVQISGHSGGTGASPLSSIKHAGIPWELGLAEVHQVLLRNGLRDRVSLRTDGGLQTGRDVVIAALLGAEEFGFGTALLVALGCDMARQCHLDTCPTGIATQRDDLRQKFTGRPEAVERLLRHIAEETRRELAAAGLSSIGDALGKTRHLRLVRGGGTLELSRLLRAPAW